MVLSSDLDEYQEGVSRDPLIPEFAKQCFYAIVISASMGSTYVLSPFTVPIEGAANPPHSLDNVWPSSTFFVFALHAPLSVVTGFLISRTRKEDQPRLVRQLSAISGAIYILLVISALGVKCSNTLLLRIGVIPLCVPVGLHTVITVHQFIIWLDDMPDATATAASASFACGLSIFSFIFNFLLKKLPVEKAIVSAAIILSTVTVSFSLLLRSPYEIQDLIIQDSTSGPDVIQLLPEANEDFPLISEASHQQNHTAIESSHSETSDLTFTDALKNLSFWLYFFSIFSAGATFALVPYFDALGATFKQSSSATNRLFHIGDLVSIAGSISPSPMCAWLRSSRGLLRFGARNSMFLLLLSMNCSCLAVLYAVRRNEDFWIIGIASANAKFLLMATYGISSVLAVQLFGPRNAALVFGIAACLAFGTGQASSIGLMMLVQKYSSTKSGIHQLSPFYYLVAIWGSLAMVGIGFMRQYTERDSPARPVL